ncbi:MAG: Clp protease ClpP [Ruminococcus sp.]|uniref:head maturation protease, ClpP-related n=1 Tax=Ruminococcus sp. TaxID=41978 RepID=UPI0025F18350|nr:head maturation protease, ClpP-related [Ruminococcus sp.]MBR5682966.1 Clp protease ClpP [Ruminococcus sp.]
MNKFWNWVRNEDTNAAELIFNGPISEDTWFGDEITPAMFRSELSKVSGDLTVWINSPGGDVFAASQIYTMLRNHKGKVTVKIDGIAASAASVVAMAGDETLIAPTGMLMIHNPATIAIGNKSDMEQAIKLLDEVKESIINAYEEKSHQSRAKIAHMMDEETWLNAKKALSLGLVDGILFDDKNNDKPTDNDTPAEEDTDGNTPDVDEPDKANGKLKRRKTEDISAMSYSAANTMESLIKRISALYTPVTGTPIEQLDKRLSLLRRDV